MPLAAATRDYAQSLDAGIYDRLRDHEIARLFCGMGPEIWAWQRARRLVGERPWRAYPHLPEDGERRRAAQLMRADIPLWERAMATLRAAEENALRYGRPAPDPLAVPKDILAIIDARLAAAAQRAARRSARGESGGPAPDGPGSPKPH